MGGRISQKTNHNVEEKEWEETQIDRKGTRKMGSTDGEKNPRCIGREGGQNMSGKEGRAYEMGEWGWVKRGGTTKKRISRKQGRG